MANKLKKGLKITPLNSGLKKDAFVIDEIKEKFVRGKKYLSAYSNGEFVFTCTVVQSQNIEKFLKNDYKVL